MDLFDLKTEKKEIASNYPLAFRMRPKTLENFIGQNNIVGKGSLLVRLIKSDRIGSIIFYGSPGIGKTTLSLIISQMTNSRFVKINAVTSNVQEVRTILDTSKKSYKLTGQRTILFVDEIHRFNKAQQDILLPDIEKNNIGFIGTTTHNPSMALTSPLVSRSHIFQFEPLSDEDIVKLLKRAVTDPKNGFGNLNLKIDEQVLRLISQKSDGDARKSLNMLEVIVLTADNTDGIIEIDLPSVQDSLNTKFIHYDKNGDEHYDTISAFIKSMRGSDPDATVYWLSKMIEAGEDPRFIVRRIIIFASEDVGNADPNALSVAVSAMKALEFIGMPEAKLCIAQAALYAACAPKSNSVTKAISNARRWAKNNRTQKVPIHLRDAYSAGAKRLNSGKGYLYPHDYEDHFVDQKYWHGNEKFYSPTELGYEKIIFERLKKWNLMRNKN
ncbi:replication-associated recombination protein A [bacterium]|nr:replication-associated recombination protein A [bacterium]